LSRIFSEMSDSQRADFTPTVGLDRDDFVVALQQEEVASPAEEAVPTDGCLRGPWRTHELCCVSGEVGETDLTSSLDPNAAPYMPRPPITTAAVTHQSTANPTSAAETDLRDGQIQNTLSEDFDCNCAIDSDLQHSIVYLTMAPLVFWYRC